MVANTTNGRRGTGLGRELPLQCRLPGSPASLPSCPGLAQGVPSSSRQRTRGPWTPTTASAEGRQEGAVQAHARPCSSDRSRHPAPFSSPPPSHLPLSSRKPPAPSGLQATFSQPPGGLGLPLGKQLPQNAGRASRPWASPEEVAVMGADVSQWVSVWSMFRSSSLVREVTGKTDFHEHRGRFWRRRSPVLCRMTRDMAAARALRRLLLWGLAQPLLEASGLPPSPVAQKPAAWGPMTQEGRSQGDDPTHGLGTKVTNVAHRGSL